MCKELAAAKKKKKDKEDSTVEMQRKMKKVLPFLKSLKMQRKIRMLKRNLQVMKLKKVIFPLKILKMQEINMEKSLQMLKKILASQVDFKNQKPLLQEIIEAKDHRVFDSIPLKYADCHVIYFFDCIFIMKVIKKSLKNFPEFDTCGAVT